MIFKIHPNLSTVKTNTDLFIFGRYDNFSYLFLYFELPVSNSH